MKKDENREEAKMSEKKDENMEVAKMSKEKDETVEKSIKAAEKKEEKMYKVLVNQEEQYALWAADHEIPNGWKGVGPTGKKEVCLSYVKEVWTDMRPKSLR
jgi:MbtH protein